MAPLPIAITTPNLKRLHDYWVERRRGQEFPARADVDPADLGFILGNLMLIDVLRRPGLAPGDAATDGGSFVFRCRLQGTRLADHLGFDLSGRIIHDMPGTPSPGDFPEQFERAVVERAPVNRIGTMTVKGAVWRYDALWLPLARDGTTIDMLLGGLLFLQDLGPMTARGAEQPADGSTRTILVVDDDEQVLELAGNLLLDHGYNVLRASTGPEALAIIEAGQPIDLLFSDIVMPQAMNGVELADRVRTRHPGVKILLTTGYATELLGHRRGADRINVLQKPYRPAELIRLVEQVFAAG